MKIIRTIRIALSLAASFMCLSGCTHENTSSKSTPGMIKAKVSSTSLDTKSSYQVKEGLARTILLDEKEALYLQEFVSDNLSQPFEDSDVRTKGSVVTTGNISTVYGLFGMEGFVNNADDIDCAEDVRPTLYGDRYIIGGTVTYGNENDWTLADNTGNEYPWLNNMDFSFWSYAPKSHPGTYAYFTRDGKQEPVREKMTITDFENPLQAKDQQDILVAYSTRLYPGDKKGEAVDILFRHALADIYFDISSITSHGLSVSGISLKGAKRAGDCIILSGNLYKTDETTGRDMVEAGFTWTPEGDPADFSMDGADDHFFMIPQAFDGALSITLSNGKTLETALTTDWEAGKYYKYKLIYNGIEISVDDEVDGNVKENVEIRSTAASTVKCYIRALIIGNWYQNLGAASNPQPGKIMAPWTINNADFEGPALPATVGAESASNWVLGADGFYYYKYPVYPNTETGTAADGTGTADKLFGTYTAPDTAPVAGTYLNVSIVAQAVKWDEDKEAATQAWGETAAAYLSATDKGSY